MIKKKSRVYEMSIMIINEIINEDTQQIIEENMGLKKRYNKTIMNTGASGMIGSYFVYTLMKLNEDYNANIKIIPLIRNLNKLNEEILSKAYVYPIVQDITDKIKYSDIVDYVIHTASPASPELMNNYPVETNFANTIGTANALIFAKEHGAKKFLFTSTREIYGKPVSNQEYFKEDTLGVINQLIPRNAYAESKKAAENMCLGFNEEYGLNTKIVRLAHTYGPGININHQMVHVEFLKKLLEKKDIILTSDGSSKRTYTYISDSVSAMFKVLLNSEEIVYNIANEKNEVSIKELAQIILSLEPEEKLKIIFDIKEEKKLDYESFKFCLLSSEKIKKELNWNAKYNVHEGFKRTYEFLKGHY